MDLHGRLGDFQLARNDLVGRTDGKAPQDIDFTVGQADAGEATNLTIAGEANSTPAVFTTACPWTSLLALANTSLRGTRMIRLSSIARRCQVNQAIPAP